MPEKKIVSKKEQATVTEKKTVYQTKVTTFSKGEIVCVEKKTTVTGKKIVYEQKEKHHKHLEILGRVRVAAAAGTYAMVNNHGLRVAAAAGTYAVHDKHQAKKNPENAHKHKIAKEVAAVATAGAAFRERRVKKH